MSDVFSHANGRTTRKVSQAPGGGSTISLGNESAALAVAKAEPEVVAEPVEAPAAEAAPAAPAETLDSLKLKAMAKISGLTKESPAVLEALAELVQKLETAAPPAPAPLEADTALAKLQAALAARGTHGIITLGKRFRSIDDDGDNKISFDEFRKALKEMEVILPEPDLHRLFRFFDADCSGYLSFDEFMVGLRGQLNARRQQMVDLAFKVLDKDNAGQITLAFIEKVYNAKMHPDVVLGIKSEREVLLEFMEVFEAQGGGQKGDGVITHDEFNRYYGSISASIDDDDYFELVIRNAWHISGGEGWCANTTCKRVLVLHTDGTQSVIEVKDDFYVNTKDVDAVKKALIEQGVKDIKGVALYGLPADIPSGDAPGTPAPPPAAAAAAAVGRAATPANSNRTHNMRSSIMFG